MTFGTPFFGPSELAERQTQHRQERYGAHAAAEGLAIPPARCSWAEAAVVNLWLVAFGAVCPLGATPVRLRRWASPRGE